MAFIGLLWGVEQGVHVWQVNAEGFTMAFWQSFLGTLKITTYSPIFLFLLFCWVAASGPQSKVHWFLTGYLAPSPVLVGFALWSVLPNGGIYSELKISLALSFIFFPSLYRWRAAGVLQGLHRQFVTAQVLGAHRWEIFKKIVFPQFAKDLFWLCGVAGLWVVGDFTVISILGFGQNTLGSLTENLLGSYQLELASVVALIIMIFGFILFWILGMVGNVISQKSYS